MENVRVERSPTHCPFCKGDLEDLREIVACAACGARHHAECHRENGGYCASCHSRAALVPKTDALDAASRLPVVQATEPKQLPVVDGRETRAAGLALKLISVLAVVVIAVAFCFVMGVAASHVKH